MNVSDDERFLGTFVGLSLAVAGLTRRGVGKWPLLVAAGALLHRSLTGHCAVYQSLGLDRRHSRSGVRGNRGTRIEASVEIRCPARTLFEFWRDLEQLPRVMRNVQSVEQRGPKRSHWRVAGPAGQSLEWDAEIINEHEGSLIAWQSLAGAAVSNAGSVRFEPISDEVTRVKVALEFDPPAGAVGEAVAGLFGTSAEGELTEDLQHFKEFAERELQGASAMGQ
ncbi:MAG: SRPBCC family protein [Chthoniobacteraceae bacterium]